MCGIIYTRRVDGKKAAKTVLKRYAKQKDRGSDGFGFVSVGAHGLITSYRRAQGEREIREDLEKHGTDHVLFHHRYPTSTINIPEAAHPILVKHKELRHLYYVVHNGVISNADEVRADHERLGYVYTTEIVRTYRSVTGRIYNGETEYNDSEAFAIDFARTLEGLQPRVKARGSIAYVVLQVARASGRLLATYYGTNGGNPLTITVQNGFTIASEGGKRLKDNVCFRMDAETCEVSEVRMQIDESLYATIGYGRTYIGPDTYDEDQELEAMREEREDLKTALEIARDLGDDDEAFNIQMSIDDLDAEIQRRKALAVFTF